MGRVPAALGDHGLGKDRAVAVGGKGRPGQAGSEQESGVEGAHQVAHDRPKARLSRCEHQQRGSEEDALGSCDHEETGPGGGRLEPPFMRRPERHHGEQHEERRFHPQHLVVDEHRREEKHSERGAHGRALFGLAPNPSDSDPSDSGGCCGPQDDPQHDDGDLNGCAAHEGHQDRRDHSPQRRRDPEDRLALVVDEGARLCGVARVAQRDVRIVAEHEARERPRQYQPKHGRRCDPSEDLAAAQASRKVPGFVVTLRGSRSWPGAAFRRALSGRRRPTARGCDIEER